MYHALDLGVSASDFWEMSPRAIWALQEQMMRGKQKKPARSEGVRLNYIPR